MLAPLSWLKEYVDITLTPKELAEKLTEVGLGVEKITKVGDDTIFEFEITPNRPDLLSIIGIAREIAAIEEKKPNSQNSQLTSGSTKNTEFTVEGPRSRRPRGAIEGSLPMQLNTDYNPFLRWTGIAIKGVTIKPSPQWMQEKLKKIGLRPINNVVDITNYVMFELGIPLHAFDYDKIRGKEMTVTQAEGGEKFTTVDEKTYALPKSAIIIKDKERIIDLAGIKGGLNSSITEKTANVFLQATVDNPILIRRASQGLGLRSDASAIYERGVDKGGTVATLKRATNLILQFAGGKVASEIIDLKKENFVPWKLTLRILRLNQILGIEIPVKKAIGILDSLNLSPVIPNEVKNPLKITKRSFAKSNLAQDDTHQKTIECTIPTYRNDLKIEEDLIEEIARFYGYNNFPKTMPVGEIPTKQIPYFMDYKLDEKVKNILKASGFSEVYTYSLISENDLINTNIKPEHVFRVDNPVSREFEYLRPTLKINLLKALTQNIPNFDKINLFELGKVYLGKNLDETQETYFLSGISNSKSFFEVKGVLEKIFEDLGIKEDPTKYIEILNEKLLFELNYSEIIKKTNLQKKFIPLPKYPPIIEDLAVVAKEIIKTLELINEIKKQSPLIVDVSLLDQFEQTRTFHIVYQHKNRNLTTEEIAKIRKIILKSLKETFKARLKE